MNHKIPVLLLIAFLAGPAVAQIQPLQRGIDQGRRFDATNAMHWGGLRLGKVDATLQEQLGLLDNEGLLVAGVEPRSAAEQAGVKTNDVLVKINNKIVPNTLDAFAKLVKEQKADEAMNLVVVRKGKEETIKAAKMPAVVQGGAHGFGAPGGFGRGGFGGAGGFGGIAGFNPGMPMNPFGNVEELDMKIKINGAVITRKQKGNDFSGEYAKDDLKITVAGKIDNGLPRAIDIVVTQGKDEKKYANLRHVPARQKIIVQQLLPSPFAPLMILPMMPDLDVPFFPGFPGIPGNDD